MGWLEGKVALVTGGASGLGRAIVERFLEEGGRVAILDRSRERSEELAKRLGSNVAATIGDVTVLADNDRAVADAVKRFGRLDCFVGNAGIWDFNMSLADLPEDRVSAAFDELFGVNVKGYLLGAKAAYRETREDARMRHLYGVECGFLSVRRRSFIYSFEACGGRADSAARLRTRAEDSRQWRSARRYPDRPAGAPLAGDGGALHRRGAAEGNGRTRVAAGQAASAARLHGLVCVAGVDGKLLDRNRRRHHMRGWTGHPRLRRQCLRRPVSIIILKQNDRSAL